ncbi:MAG: peptidoglycan editing factor PgeF [bacterium]|nr:peptidoglycan editing factor PgeF [bacterium]
MFELREFGDVKYYVPTTIEATGIIRAGFSTREGGVSGGCYRSMNLRWHCDDTHENVLENYRRITNALGIDYRGTVLSKQVHEAEVRVVGEKDKGNGITRENEYKSADALITNEKGVALAATFADCTPVFFADPVRRVIAIAHSGWRGTVKRISTRVIEKMISDYRSEPENILCAIGPSIQLDHFEVGDDVAKEFIDEFGEDTVKLYGSRYHVSMQTAVKKSLTEAGVPSGNIDDSGICTYCNSDLLFSHRKTNGKRGNLGAFMQLI